MTTYTPSFVPQYRSKTIQNIYDIDLEALYRGEILDQSFNPWAITENELRDFVKLHVCKMGNKRPFVTFSRRNRSHVPNHIYCNPAEKFCQREQIKRDERYSIATTGKYEYYVENGERMSLGDVRLRIGSWIKRNCCQTYRTSYDPVTHVMTFYNPNFDPDEKERNQREFDEEVARLQEADDRPEW